MAEGKTKNIEVNPGRYHDVKLENSKQYSLEKENV